MANTDGSFASSVSETFNTGSRKPEVEVPVKPDHLHSSSSLSIASNPHELVGLHNPIQRGERSLGDYFTIDEIPRTNYSDEELASIARLLEAAGRETWGRIPRIYTVLRQTGQIAAIDSFLDEGLNDMWFPFNITQLPLTMSVFHRSKFIEAQSMVFTKAMDLENTNVKKHTHFKRGEEFPLIIGEQLGHGGYASVHKAHSRLTGRTYALKKFKRVKTNRREVEGFMTELQVLQRINHHHCVELVASYTDSKTFGLLISPVADCNLASFYKVVTHNEDNRRILRTLFGCLAHALQYLHRSQIRHRDIKPENILVKGTEVFLADFGISLDWENLTRSTTTADSAKSWMYCAPEVANYQKRNCSSDIWSLGCVFLEMFATLKGMTLEDLRGVLAAHSGQPRYYENLDPAMKWAEKLNESGIDAEKEVMRWIREMMIIEPSHRITAQSLCLTIVKFGIKSKNKEEANMFCGECCTHDHELELSSGTVSDDDAWEGDFGAGLTTPATTVVTTNKSQRADESISVQEIQPQRTHSFHFETEDIGRLELSDALGEEPVNDNAQNEKGSRQSLTRPVVEPIESGHISSSSNEVSLEPKLRQPIETNEAISTHLQSDGPSRAKEDVAERKKLNKPYVPTKGSPNEASLDFRTKIRRELYQEVTNRHTLWTFVDLRNRLPALSASSWNGPQEFLSSVQSDVSFMRDLDSIVPFQHMRFQSAGLDDLFPMIHLLLLNGLDVNNPKYQTTHGRSQNFTPLTCTINSNWSGTQAHRDVAKLLIGFGAMLDHESKYYSVAYHAFKIAMEYRNRQMLPVILSLGPDDLIEEVVGGLPPVYYAAVQGDHVIVDILIKHGFNFQDGKHGGMALIKAVAERGHVGVIKVLVAHGMDVNEKTSLKTSIKMSLVGITVRGPLYTAALNGQLEAVKFLLFQGADPTQTGILRAAQLSKNLEVVYIIEKAIRQWRKQSMGRRVGFPLGGVKRKSTKTHSGDLNKGLTDGTD